MASNDNEILLQCCKCQKQLDMEGKTLTCLHSFCETCVNKEIQRQTNGNGQCPLCDEIIQFDQLTLSPILVSYLKCRQMESTKWKCDLCLKDGNESIATVWCSDCMKLFCTNCSQFHKKLHQKHNTIDVVGIGKDEVREAMKTDICNIHKKVEEWYCEQCNMCLCDACYTTHLQYPSHCSSPPMSVRVEALKKQNSQGPTLLKEINNLEKSLLERHEKSLIYSEELERLYNLKCKEIWQSYEDIVEELRDKTHEMCNELRLLKEKQVEKWRQLLDENERLLKKLEILRIYICHLLKKDKKKKDIVFGVELVGKKLASLSPQLHQSIIKPVRKCELEVKFSNYWLQFLQGLKNQMIGSVSLNFPRNLVKLENEWNLPGSNLYSIESILVTQEDNHIFLADSSSCSIIELTESGELISQCRLIYKGKKFYPLEMVLSSSEILVVICFLWWGEKKLLFLERKKFSPFLEIKKITDTKKRISDSVCQINEAILICDGKFQIDFYTKNGKYIKTVNTGESRRGDYRPRIRADPSTGNFWAARQDTCKIFCFNEEGQKLQSFETVEKIWDFFINEFGNLYFCNFEGIFSFFPEKNVCKFQEKSEICPKIFVSKDKIFVYLQINKKKLIRIFTFIE